MGPGVSTRPSGEKCWIHGELFNAKRECPRCVELVLHDVAQTDSPLALLAMQQSEATRAFITGLNGRMSRSPKVEPPPRYEPGLMLRAWWRILDLLDDFNINIFEGPIPPKDKT